MTGYFEFDIDKWLEERDEQADHYLQKLDKEGDQYKEAVLKVYHYVHACLVEQLFVRHYIFRKRMKLYFGRPDVSDEDVLRAAAMDSLGLNHRETANRYYNDLVFQLRGDISRTVLPHEVIDQILSAPHVDAGVFGQILVKHSRSPASRR